MWHFIPKGHCKGPLISLLALVHPGVTFPVLVLARTGRCNQGGVQRRAFPEHQAFAGQRSVDGGQDLFSQLMLFQQATQAQDADPLGNALDAGQAYELPAQRGLEQGFLHGQLGQAQPLPNEVDAQHGFEFKRRTPCLGSRCVRRNQREQFRARRHEILLVQQHRLGVCAACSSSGPGLVASRPYRQAQRHGSLVTGD